MGVTYCYKPPRCGSRRHAHAPAHAPASANVIGNSNFSNKKKALYISGQLNAQLIGSVAVPISILNFNGNTVQVNVPITTLPIGDVNASQVNGASIGSIIQPAFAANNQNNDS